MEYLTREETAKHLLDFSNLFNKLEKHPNLTVFEILGTYIRPDIKASELTDYFNKMKNIYHLTNAIRILNFFEESLSNDIDE